MGQPVVPAQGVRRVLTKMTLGREHAQTAPQIQTLCLNQRLYYHVHATSVSLEMMEALAHHVLRVHTKSCPDHRPA